MMHIVLALLLAAFAAFFVPAARATAICGDDEALTRQLHKEHGERPVGLGINQRGILTEIWASEEGSWSVILTRPGMPSCIVVWGYSWTNTPPVPEWLSKGEEH